MKGIVQIPLKHWQVWGIDHLSRKPVPAFDHPFSKETLPNVQSKPLVQLWTIPTCPITGYQGEESIKEDRLIQWRINGQTYDRELLASLSTPHQFKSHLVPSVCVNAVISKTSGSTILISVFRLIPSVKSSKDFFLPPYSPHKRIFFRKMCYAIIHWQFHPWVQLILPSNTIRNFQHPKLSSSLNRM